MGQKGSLLVLYSYHHKNTEKIARAVAKVLDAEIKTPHEVRPEELRDYGLVGFGSGIYGEKLHKTVLELADGLPQADGGKAFIYSTNGAPAWLFSEGMSRDQMARSHSLIKEKLQAKGYAIVGEFSCAGFNTNSFLKFFGGINKGRPDVEDLKRAEAFALSMKQTLKDR